MARLKLNNLRSRDIWIFAAPLLAFAAILLHHTVVNVLVIEFKPGLISKPFYEEIRFDMRADDGEPANIWPLHGARGTIAPTAPTIYF